MTTQVNFHKGNRLLRVRSSLLLENVTSVPVDIQLTVGDRVTVLGPIGATNAAISSHV